MHGPYRPLFYNLADEAGIADLAAFWDFDLSAASLAGFRDWLRGEYDSVAALNAEWQTDFATWDQVVPDLTDAALRRSDDNFAAWSDFKAWMDEAFSRAVRAGTDALHAADPSALAGLEGTQPQGWGGYDYTRLAGAVDVMECSGGADSIEIARAFNPALVVLTTSSGQGGAEARQIWRALLLGSRGLVVWDEGGLVDADGTPGPRGRFLAPLLRELRGGIAARLIASTPIVAKVAILLSPPSFRVHWLLDRRADGVPWEARGSEAEYDSGTADRRSLPRAVHLLTGLGLRPAFVSPEGLARGGLLAQDMRVLVLPQSIALSDAEATAIRAFMAAGGRVLADGEPGLFDGHGRRRPAPALAGTLAPSPLESLPGLLQAAGIAPGFTLTRDDGKPASGLEAHTWRSGNQTILALLTNEHPQTITLSLPQPTWVRDLRRNDAPVRTDRQQLSLPADGPVLLELSGTAE